MLGLMQDRPLLISSLIEHAAACHADTEIVSRLPEGPIRRTTWSQVRDQSKQVANALAQLGIEPADRVATLAWNSDRHLALYYGVSGSGAVMHTVNPRLFAEQIVYIINHAEDRVLFFDVTFAALVAALAPELETVEHFVAMTDREHMADLPGIPAERLLCFDELVAAQSSDYDWPEFDERSASSLCYTSGTTGNPKGVLYSHRSTVLHAMLSLSRDTFDIHSGATLLLVVPMFHANAWGTPYSAAMVGAKLVLPGPHLDGESVYQLMRDERVTIMQGVPTVWLMLFGYLDQHPEIDPSELVLEWAGIGGSALSQSMLERIERDLGAEGGQGWGMTETLGSSRMALIGGMADLSREEKLDRYQFGGRRTFATKYRLEDDDVPRVVVGVVAPLELLLERRELLQLLAPLREHPLPHRSVAIELALHLARLPQQVGHRIRGDHRRRGGPHAARGRGQVRLGRAHDQHARRAREHPRPVHHHRQGVRQANGRR